MRPYQLRIFEHRHQICENGPPLRISTSSFVSLESCRKNGSLNVLMGQFGSYSSLRRQIMVRRKCKLVELIIIWYIENTGWIETCLFMCLRLTAVTLKKKRRQ